MLNEQNNQGNQKVRNQVLQTITTKKPSVIFNRTHTHIGYLIETGTAAYYASDIDMKDEDKVALLMAHIVDGYIEGYDASYVFADSRGFYIYLCMYERDYKVAKILSLANGNNRVYDLGVKSWRPLPITNTTN